MNGLAVLFPELESVTAPVRDRHDPAAARGLGPHVTVLYPFREPEAMSPADRERLSGIVAATTEFDVRFPAFGRFENTLYLVPDPAEPFAALTRAVCEAFPGYPPYGGVYDGLVPHLTLADGDVVPTPDLDLPLTGRARAVSHLTLTENRWHEVERHPLGPGERTVQ